MKKLLAILLAAIMCLSLVACSGGSGETPNANGNGGTQDNQTTVEDPVKKERYESALSLLKKGLQGGDKQSETFQEAYQILTELGDYKDAKEYLKRFTILPDKPLYWIMEDRNAFGEITHTVQLHYHYDAAGRVIAAPNRKYYSPSSFNITERFYYDDQGRVIQKDSMVMLGDTTTLYTYNDAGELTETKVMLYESTYSLAKHFYNEAGQEIRRERTFEDGTKTAITYTYDDAGNCACKEEQTTNKQYPTVTTYQYDSAGNCIQSVSKTELEHGFSSTSVQNYEYDSAGKLLLYTSGSLNLHYTYEGDRLVSTKYIRNHSDKIEEYVANYTYGDYYVYTPAE